MANKTISYREKFLLLDAHSIIFRSYFAFIKNPLKNARGENTSGIFGFLNTLEKVKKRLFSEYICLAFDAPGETFRDKVFKEYKATRPAPPKDIPFQIIKVKEIAHYLGIPSFEVEGYEADDVLATLAKKLKGYGEVYIVSSDKDLLQLVGDNIYIYDAYRDLIYDKEQVVEKIGVPPERVAEYLALTGDNIDNVPGVPGIGPQRAVEILNKYPKLEEAVEQDKRIVEHKDLLSLSKNLVTLECNVPLKFHLGDLRIKEPDIPKLMPILIDLEFHSYIKEIGKRYRPDIELKEIEISKINIQGIFGISAEEDKIYLCNKKDYVYFTSLGVAKSLLANQDIIKVGHNLKEITKHTTIKSPIFDLEIATWLLNPNLTSYALEDIGLQYLHNYLETTPPVNANLSYRLYPIIKEKLEELNLLDLYQNIEEPLVFVLAKMEKRGIKIDIPYLKSLGREIEKMMMEIEEAIYKLAGQRFNINSPKQLSKVLFEDLKLSPTKKTKTHYSTDVEVLQQLSLRHPLPREILRYRELSKINSTYITPLITLVKNSRIHTTYDQTGTATGRLSSFNPNIQNIPIRSDLGKRIRKGFIADKGFLFISADYSQIELRLLAHITKDSNLIKAFKEGKDIHNHTASLVFNIGEDEVNEQKRRMAKVVNYGLIYGMSDYGLAQGLDIPKEEATQFIETYYALYPDVDKWRIEAINSALDKGYTETLLGRKRPLPDIYSENYNLKEAAKRAAINTPIQGTAADLIKLAMINVEKKLTNAKFKSGLLLSIHDELLFEIEEEKIEEAKRIIKEAMENVMKFDVPIEVTIGIGKNWAEAH